MVTIWKKSNSFVSKNKLFLVWLFSIIQANFSPKNYQ